MASVALRFVACLLLVCAWSPGWAYGTVAKSEQTMACKGFPPPVNCKSSPEDFHVPSSTVISNRSLVGCTQTSGGNGSIINGARQVGNFICTESVSINSGSINEPNWQTHTETYDGFMVAMQACPSDSTEQQSGQCQCNNGFEPNGASACKATNCSDVANKSGGATFSWSGSGKSFCYKGCVMRCSVCGYHSGTNKSSAEGFAVGATGESCMGSGNSGTDPSVSDNAAKCPTGQCPGTVNGVAVCVACSVSQDGPSGNSPPGASDPAAPPGTDHWKDSTKCENGQCTSKRDYFDGQGNNIGSRETTQEQKGFCDQNPTLSICKAGSISGACDQVQCSGDPVQCAIAKEQARRNCEFFNASATSDIGLEAMSGTVTVGPHLPGTAVVEELGLETRLDTSDGGLTGSCPADGSFSVLGLGVSLPFSDVCGPLAMLGNVLMGLAMLAAIRIIFGG